MRSKSRAMLRRVGHFVFVAACGAMLPQAVHAQAWGATKFFQYNIENVAVKPAGPGTWKVKVIFSVTNPVTTGTWDIKNALPFQSPGASLMLDIGWDSGTDFTNAGSANQLLALVATTALGGGAAIPVQVRSLQDPATDPVTGEPKGAARCANNVECPGAAFVENRFWVERTVSPVAVVKAVTYGRVAIEGKPVCNGVNGFLCPPGVFSPGPPPATTYANIPVRSEVASFKFEATENKAAIVPDLRRKIVDIAKRSRRAGPTSFRCRSGPVPFPDAPFSGLSVRFGVFPGAGPHPAALRFATPTGPRNPLVALPPG